MQKIQINNKIYSLPLGDLYVNKFQAFVKENILRYNLFSILSLKDECKCKKELFGMICNALTLYNDSEYAPKIVKDICSKMWLVNDMVKYMIKEGKYEYAIKKMDEFTVAMLEVVNKMNQIKTI